MSHTKCNCEILLEGEVVFYLKNYAIFKALGVLVTVIVQKLFRKFEWFSKLL